MLKLPEGQTTPAERDILRKLRVWIMALGAMCLVTGIGIGAMLAGRPLSAQSEAQIARAPEALSASFVEIARRVEPAVVNIDTKIAPPEMAAGDDEDKEDQPSAANKSLLDMFRRRQRPARGVGSGFIVDAKGFILTNQHVVEGASRIVIRLQSGEEFPGRVIGVDEETDVAVVKVDAPRDLPVVKLGDSNGAQVGDWVLAIGSPFGLDQTVTAGIISTKERSDPAHFTSFQQFLQTDAAINRGNSGGPLVNMRGEVIGINSQIATSTGDYNGIGFALPATAADFVYKQIVATGKVKRGYLGINLEDVKGPYARVYGLPEAKGVIVTNLAGAQSPAAKAGLQAGDVIVELNNQPVINAQDLINRVSAVAVGQTVQLTYLRDTATGSKLERRTASVAVGERPASLTASRAEEETPASKNPKKPVSDKLPLGITLAELTPQLVAEKNLTGVRGLLVKDVDPNGIAADVRLAGGQPAIREGDVIQRINRVPVATLEDFRRVAGALKPGDAIVLNIATYNEGSDRVIQRIVQFTYQ
ncbi:MAG: trypsin-like peptidase domain-containing protein [Pyrinomonadaceae bacterium]